ncbi:ricin-type beta-trefoil lectin domain protein [Kutzneria buriramensis]|uniref:Alpha-galactosidase n=1 Tax=Kutzneria buriramensis TaxID=1045776 RepID=A0A3E0GYJ8_9PSEU|nr:ricin-type beta-trefoil lectin domain protein [Kutzneria buriramensis]REH32609.1 alpha-galactosidase [Kutzneria buriramensis]
MRTTLLLAAVTAASLLTPVTATAAPPLAATPPMGWNDWAHYQCDFTEQTILSNADALVATGLAAKGYDTVTIDDCWMAKSRDSSGNLVADKTKFPDGMAYVGQYLHNHGLRFGIYEDAGTLTCGGYPGSWNHFQQDANRFAGWGVDYLKLDGCNLPSVAGQTEEQTYKSAYAQQAAALAKSGRKIVFSESAPAYFQGQTSWYSVLSWVKQYGQLWREGYDIATYDKNKPDASRWGSVLGNYGYNSPIGRYAGPGNWNDPDFLIAGDGGMTADESRSQVALWAMMAAPMILSSDVSKLSPEAVATLGNKDIVAVDQDSLGKQGTVYAQNGTTDVLYRPLANGDRAVAILNRGGSAVTTSTTVGLNCSFTAKDLWTGASSNAISATIPSHGTAIFRVKPGSDCGAVKPVGQIAGTSGKCVDDSGSGTADGNPVVLWPCTGTANQRWQLSGNTVQTLGKCLANSANKAVLSTCDGSASQQWSYKLNGNLVNSGLCLDVTGGGSDNGTALELYQCGDNQLNQIWSLPS